jgi:F-type H+-transporting ATPase subunit gamma
LSKRRDVEKRITSLRDIQDIMDSMKKLAMIEARKLTRFNKLQQQVVESITLALNDVRGHFISGEPAVEAPPVYLLLGAERGFCGAYNEQILEVLAQLPGSARSPLIAVGSRLAVHAQKAYPDAVCLSGAAVADEVDLVLVSIIRALNSLRREHGPVRLEVIRLQPDARKASCQTTLPPVSGESAKGLPPLVNMPPHRLLGALLEQYLFALAHGWLFESLLAENQRRIQHLDQAVHKLERRCADLEKRRNRLRQEEIIEEIEVILLNSASLGEAITNRDARE